MQIKGRTIKYTLLLITAAAIIIVGFLIFGGSGGPLKFDFNKFSKSIKIEFDEDFPRVTASFLGKSISFSPVNFRNGAKAEKVGEKLIWRDVYPDTDLLYERVDKGVKETIILKGKKAPKSFGFRFNITEGIVFKKDKNNNIIFTADNKYLYHIPAPVMWDGLGKASTGIDVRILRNKENDSDFVFTFKPSEKWLNSPERVYPIYLDPSIIHDTEAEFDAGKALNRVESLAGPKVQLPYHELPADEHTVGLWHMNETSNDSCSGGADVCDSSGNGNHGTESGGVTIDTTNQKLGAAARSFDGGDDYINTGTGINISNSSFSVGFWAKREATGTYHYVVGQGSGSTDNGLHIGFRNTNVFTCAFYADDLNTPTSYTDSNWHHWACTYDVNSNARKIYRDGTLVASDTASGDYQGTGNLYIGSRWDGTTNYFNGLIDEVRILNRALTPEEIKADAERRPYGVYTSSVLDLGSDTALKSIDSISWTEAGVQTGDGETLYSSTDLVAQWNFNDGTAGQDITTADNAAGSCGASCDGTLNGFATACTTGLDGCAGSGWTSNNGKWPASAPEALMFDGSDDYIYKSISNFRSSDNTGTITAWIKTTRTVAQRVFMSSDEATDSFYIGLSTAPEVRFQSSVGSIYVRGQTDLSDDKWHHIAVSSDGSQYKLYVDGIEETVTVVNGSNNGTWFDDVANRDNITIGAMIRQTGNPNNPFLGTIDSVRIYSRVLGADEILSNYQAGNIELQTRTGPDNTPDDGDWEEWRPVTTETQISSMDSDQNNWSWDSTATYMPKSKSDDSTTKIEGTGSMKTTVGAPQVDANTVGLWHLEETGGTGAYIKDATTNNYDGTPFETTVVDGFFGKARSFDGDNDYIDIGTGPTSLNSVEFWVYPETTTEYFVNLTGTTDYIWADAGTVTATGFSDPTIYVNGVASTAIVASKWQHVAVTTATAENASNLDIGRTADTNYFQGLIDEVRISNVARTAEEIAEAYRAGRDHRLSRTITSADLSGNTKLPFYIAADRPGTYLEAAVGETDYSIYQTDSNTVGLWHLEEESGSGAYIKDSSGNGNHGTPTGTTFTQGKIGKARSFDGVDDYVSVDDSSSLDITDEITIEAWVRDD